MIKQIYMFKCDYCGFELRDEVEIVPRIRAVHIKPYLAIGFHIIGRNLICVECLAKVTLPKTMEVNDDNPTIPK